jgi:hypothetical protein
VVEHGSLRTSGLQLGLRDVGWSDLALFEQLEPKRFYLGHNPVHRDDVTRSHRNLSDQLDVSISSQSSIITDAMVAGITASSRLVGGCPGTQPGSLLKEFAALGVGGSGALLGARSTMCLHLRLLLLAIG